MDLLMGKNSNPAGLWVWVWERSTHTRKPMGFLNVVHNFEIFKFNIKEFIYYLFSLISAYWIGLILNL